MKTSYKKYLKYIFLLIIFLGSLKTEASIINGSIDLLHHTAQVCVTTSCTVTPYSSVNFGVFTTSPGSNVVVSDTELTGFIWGESFGWVVLNCANTTSGCSVNNNNFKITNDYNGSLSGYAWGEDAGWVNFGPFLNNAATPVVINSSGQFNGYAWSENFGWIKFDCSDSNYCVQTDWRPRNVRPQCSDGIDNENDGYIDSADSGCINNGVYDPTDDLEYRSSPGGISTPPPTPDFCTLNPTDPSCVTQSFCTLNPTDPTCNPVPPPNPQTFCEIHPTDPTCNPELPPPTFCTVNPTDPTCNPVLPPPVVTPPTPRTPPTTGSRPIVPQISQSISGFVLCISHPTDPSCIIPSPIKDVITKAPDFLDKPVVKVVTQTVVGLGAATWLTHSLISSLFENPFTLSDLAFLPVRLWGLLLSALGLKKRNRPWGTVYDSVTKQPVDPAYVVLQDIKGNEFASSITDLDGRYGFLVPAGQYRMIANKTNYAFPSNKLKGKESDELYQDLYFGEVLDIADDEVIKKNIPMDPIGFDWNEFEKQKQHLMKFYSRRDLWLNRIANTLFVLGFSFTVITLFIKPTTYNIITLGLYVLLFILSHTVLKPKLFGLIVNKENNIPVPYAIIRVYSTEMHHEVIKKTSNKIGKYYCLIPNGSYYVTVENKNPDGSYSLVYTSSPLEVKNSYLSKKFEI